MAHIPTTNEHTGKAIKTGVNSDAYRNNPYWDRLKADKERQKKQEEEKKKEPGE